MWLGTKSGRYPIGPEQLLRRDSRNHHRETRFIGVVSIYRALRRTAREGCLSGSLADRTHQGVLVISDRAEHENEVRFPDPCFLQCLLCGLTTCYVRIMMPTHADPGFGSHGRTSCLLLTYLNLGSAEQHLLRRPITPHHGVDW